VTAVIARFPSFLLRALLVLGLLAGGMAQPSWAGDLQATGATPPAPPAQPASAAAATAAAQQESREKSAIRAITADPVFGGKKEEYEWRYTGDVTDTPADNSEPPSWFQSLRDALEFMSRVLRFLVWIGLAVLIAVLIYLSYRYRNAWLGPLGGRRAAPDFLFGLDVRPESLPDDVVAAALKELARGNATGALSLLYRGALISLIHHSQLDFHAGHTEGDCLRLVRAAVDAGGSGYFADLLEAWKRTAYGHEPPPAPALESLCVRWREHFAQVEAPR
jgi:hypothetical protein